VSVILGGKVVELTPGVHLDERGVLTSFAFDQHDFAAVRTFVVQAPDGTVRGGHGHRSGRQVLLWLSGEIEVELRYRSQIERVVLNENRRAILIEPPVWARQRYRGASPSILVLCDTRYDADDYLEEPVE
jgi:dTDP-4-dehydrorhamnose 3,5-epimerase-like enzyme